MKIESTVYKECKYSPEINRSSVVQSRYKSYSQKAKKQQTIIKLEPEKIEEQNDKIASFISRMRKEAQKREERKKKEEVEKKEFEKKELQEMKNKSSRVFSSSYIKNYGREITPKKTEKRIDFKESCELILDDDLILNFKLTE